MTVLPDIELLTGVYLRGRSDVAALVPGHTAPRVGDQTPRDTSKAWVRLWQIDDDPAASSPALWLVTTRLQVDCYAGDGMDGHAEASLLARTVREALHDMPEAPHAGAVVSAVRFQSGLRRMPDSDLRGRERFLFDALITARPA